MEDIKFRDYSNILISGQTQSGKSEFIKKMLIHSDDLFVTPPEVALIPSLAYSLFGFAL